MNQHLGKRLLERLGYEVVTANNGKEAIEEVAKTQFSCCFMDCQVASILIHVLPLSNTALLADA